MCWGRSEGTEGRGTQPRPSGWLTDAAAAGGVQQEAVRAHARVPTRSVGTLPVLAAPTSRALIHICGEGRGVLVVPGTTSPPAPPWGPSLSHHRPGSPSQDPLTLSKPVGHGRPGAPAGSEFPAERAAGRGEGEKVEKEVGGDEGSGRD